MLGEKMIFKEDILLKLHYIMRIEREGGREGTL